MVVAPHVDRFAWTLGLNDDVEISLHLFIDPAHIPVLVSNDMLWHLLRRPYLFSYVGGAPLAPAKSCESNSCPF